mmetsp:Transcript_32111/g.73447  ORF Transcript_32111/g.73447 Transcript_32111/m.73447 type:complete len:227 (-) Transcript_32111:178-858(-)
MQRGLQLMISQCAKCPAGATNGHSLHPCAALHTKTASAHLVKWLLHDQHDASMERCHASTGVSTSVSRWTMLGSTTKSRDAVTSRPQPRAPILRQSRSCPECPPREARQWTSAKALNAKDCMSIRPSTSLLVSLAHNIQRASTRCHPMWPPWSVPILAPTGLQLSDSTTCCCQDQSAKPRSCTQNSQRVHLHARLLVRQPAPQFRRTMPQLCCLCAPSRVVHGFAN